VTNAIKLRQEGREKLIIAEFTLPHEIFMCMNNSLLMTINFKWPENMKGLSNNLGSIPRGRKTELSSIMQTINPKPTKPHWQRKQQMLTWSNFIPKDSWKEGRERSKQHPEEQKVAATRNYTLQELPFTLEGLSQCCKGSLRLLLSHLRNLQHIRNPVTYLILNKSSLTNRFTNKTSKIAVITHYRYTKRRK